MVGALLFEFVCQRAVRSGFMRYLNTLDQPIGCDFSNSVGGARQLASLPRLSALSLN